MKPGPSSRFYRGLAVALPVGTLMWIGIVLVGLAVSAGIGAVVRWLG